MNSSILLKGRDVKIAYLLITILVISLILSLIGFWIGIHRALELNDPLLAIPTLFILVFLTSSLIVFLISIWPTSLKIEFSEVDKVKDVKQEKNLPEDEPQKEKMKPNIKVKQENTFENREAEFLESSAYQFLFDYVRKIIKENDVHIYWEKTDLNNLLTDPEQLESFNNSEGNADNNSKVLNQLRLLLAKKRFYFSEDEFKTLVENELFRQTYEDLKKYILYRDPQELEDYISYFLEFVKKYEYPHIDTRELIQKFINGELDVFYLKKILDEQNVDHSEELLQEMGRVGDDQIT
ncbi:MAG: hypothetical protein R6U44_03475 [Archaeoglobaceae archaeon]